MHNERRRGTVLAAPTPTHRAQTHGKFPARNRTGVDDVASQTRSMLHVRHCVVTPLGVTARRSGARVSWFRCCFGPGSASSAARATLCRRHEKILRAALVARSGRIASDLPRRSGCPGCPDKRYPLCQYFQLDLSMAGHHDCKWAVSCGRPRRLHRGTFHPGSDAPRAVQLRRCGSHRDRRNLAL
jgi:hypothetical protein